MATVVEQGKSADHVSRYVSRYAATRGRFAVRALMVDGRARRGAGTLHERRISDDAR